MWYGRRAEAKRVPYSDREVNPSMAMKCGEERSFLQDLKKAREAFDRTNNNTYGSTWFVRDTSATPKAEQE